MASSIRLDVWDLFPKKLNWFRHPGYQLIYMYHYHLLCSLSCFPTSSTEIRFLDFLLGGQQPPPASPHTASFSPLHPQLGFLLTCILVTPLKCCTFKWPVCAIFLAYIHFLIQKRGMRASSLSVCQCAKSQQVL